MDKYAELRAALDDGSFDFDRRSYANDVRALLAERDDVLENGKQAVRWAPLSAHWSNELKRLFGQDAREGIDVLEAQLRAAQSGLRDDDYIIYQARAALAQEQGGSDGQA